MYRKWHTLNMLPHKNAPSCNMLQLTTFYISQGLIKVSVGPGAVPKCKPLANI